MLLFTEWSTTLPMYRMQDSLMDICLSISATQTSLPKPVFFSVYARQNLILINGLAHLKMWSLLVGGVKCCIIKTGLQTRSIFTEFKFELELLLLL